MMLVKLRFTYANIISVLTGQSPDFVWLTAAWGTFCESSNQDLNVFRKSFLFFDSYGGNLFDKVDRFLVESFCAPQ